MLSWKAVSEILTKLGSIIASFHWVCILIPPLAVRNFAQSNMLRNRLIVLLSRIKTVNDLTSSITVWLAYLARLLPYYFSSSLNKCSNTCQLRFLLPSLMVNLAGLCSSPRFIIKVSETPIPTEISSSVLHLQSCPNNKTAN